MKPYPVAALRSHLAEALNLAESGEAVFVERRGVRYRLTVEPPPGPPKRPRPLFEPDSALLEHGFSWSFHPDRGLELVVESAARPAGKRASAVKKPRRRTSR